MMTTQICITMTLYSNLYIDDMLVIAPTLSKMYADIYNYTVGQFSLGD